MPAWPLLRGAGGSSGDPASEWFSLRYARARALATAAGVALADNFDTLIGEDFAQSATTELVDEAGAASYDADDFYSGGVRSLTVGDSMEALSTGRIQLLNSSSHVGAGKSWYAASLVRLFRPPDEELGDTIADCIGLYSSDTNRVGLGIFTGSGGSVTNWTGYAIKDASATTSIGPALDDQEGPVWHLFEAWYIAAAAAAAFAIDGVPFDDTIAAAALPTGQPLRLSMLAIRSAVGQSVAPAFDKATVIVRSPRVGETD